MDKANLSLFVKEHLFLTGLLFCTIGCSLSSNDSCSCNQDCRKNGSCCLDQDIKQSNSNITLPTIDEIFIQYQPYHAYGDLFNFTSCVSPWNSKSLDFDRYRVITRCPNGSVCRNELPASFLEGSFVLSHDEISVRYADFY